MATSKGCSNCCTNLGRRWSATEEECLWETCTPVTTTVLIRTGVWFEEGGESPFSQNRKIEKSWRKRSWRRWFQRSIHITSCTCGKAKFRSKTTTPRKCSRKIAGFPFNHTKWDRKESKVPHLKTKYPIVSIRADALKNPASIDRMRWCLLSPTWCFTTQSIMRVPTFSTRNSTKTKTKP